MNGAPTVRNFAELEKGMSPESLARSDAIYRQHLVEMLFVELRSMMKKMVLGHKPSEIFRALIESDSTLTNRDVSKMFDTEFPDIDGGATILLRRWAGFGRISGISDSDLDAVLSQLLRVAGYVKDGD